MHALARFKSGPCYTGVGNRVGQLQSRRPALKRAQVCNPGITYIHANVCYNITSTLTEMQELPLCIHTREQKYTNCLENHYSQSYSTWTGCGLCVRTRMPTKIVWPWPWPYRPLQLLRWPPETMCAGDDIVKPLHVHTTQCHLVHSNKRTKSPN